MDGEKPKTIDKYKEWLKKEHGIQISNQIQDRYEATSNVIMTAFKESDFWVQLISNLRVFNDEYLVEEGYDLLASKSLIPELYIKPFDSFLSKTFRKNILENKNWPDEPKEGGWILPNNWYSKINDIVRTLFVVRYLDGVEFLIDKIKDICNQQELSCNTFLEARDDGYYAAHLYIIGQEFEVPAPNWDTEKVKTQIEIQITTQLQDVIRTLLHKYYGDKRVRTKEENVKWQWNYKNDEFIANYLGHILHYVEGMIMEIRERQRRQ